MQFFFFASINVCAAVLNDSEKKRCVGCIRVVTFREAYDAGAFLGCSTASLWVAVQKFCLRSRRILSLRDPAIKRKAARNLAKKSNNVVFKLFVMPVEGTLNTELVSIAYNKMCYSLVFSFSSYHA